MPRVLRLEFAGAVYHVTGRGNARQDIYLDDADRRRFLDLLGREVMQQRWRCYAYCLMNNHYHLLFETPEANLVAGMRRLNGVYTQGFNHRHDWVGHLFQGRYKSILVDRDSYLLELCRYVVLNPVRAGLVRRPEDWPWSSYRATAGTAPVPAWLDRVAVTALFAGQGGPADAAYRRFVADGVDKPSPWDQLRGQTWLGNARFRDLMERRVRNAGIEGVTDAARRPARPERETVLDAVSRAYGIARAELAGRRDAAAYRAAAYLLRRAGNLPLRTVAETFGVSAARISRIQREIESGRTDPALTKLIADFGVDRS